MVEGGRSDAVSSGAASPRDRPRKNGNGYGPDPIICDPSSPRTRMFDLRKEPYGVKKCGDVVQRL
ncbi:hypothetical protein AKJ50_00545 [candidate division MSBL1 archaeon SCGC-AAA382A13]|uniref:Uncharacterized protein n=1 Tax=candidate division MSBL1 archaeon SCGC-AAA382A13 TaxID=1698279 RepID=A0A133VGJ1_9EURY|nr:hypothetical protein AKJ50_00545 [candidate division MSBL1 archaeon SCGC-AAA382A13]